jgi:hypothetical protein
MESGLTLKARPTTGALAPSSDLNSMSSRSACLQTSQVLGIVTKSINPSEWFLQAQNAAIFSDSLPQGSVLEGTRQHYLRRNDSN